jgi:hypothetical protein
MNGAACRCDSCSALLPSADAVCPRCEAELAAPVAPVGRFVCPHCAGRFEQLAQVAWPPNVPWWRPTTMRLQCPHCSTPLRDRHLPHIPGWIVAAVLVGAVASQLFTSGRTRLILAVLALGAVYGPLAWMAWRHRHQRNDPDRYIVGVTRFWAQGNDRLRRPD